MGQVKDAFNAVATLLINAYKKMGHDLVFRSGWSDVVVSLAAIAILCVDDTDLLYRIAQLDMTDEEFVTQLQVAVNHWVYLVQASGSGGHIKRAKSFWYITLFDFVNGVATPRRLPSMSSLKLFKFKILITLPSLGVFSSPSNAGWM